MSTATSKKHDENEIRDLIGQWAAAVAQKDVNKIMSFYSDDVRVFDVPPPLQVKGKVGYRKNWEDWLRMFRGDIECTIRDLNITASSDTAFASCLTHIGEKGNGSGSWVRVTVGYRRTGDKWLATHEHVSLPFNGQTGESVSNLKP